MNITYREIEDADYGYLYYLLATRPKCVNISHEELPTWDDHCAHWNEVVDMWDCGIIMVDGSRAGYYYVTYRNEIGIHIDEKYRRNGIAEMVLGYICTAHGNSDMLANVAIANKASQALFDKAGFEPIQVTYRKRKKAQ